MLMSYHHITEQNHNVKTANKSLKMWQSSNAWNDSNTSITYMKKLRAAYIQGMHATI
jgi:hypothetical protein